MVVSALAAMMFLSGCPRPVSDREAPHAAVAAPHAGQFDASRAFADLKRQVAFGPRIPGTKGHAACRDWIVAELGKSFPGAVVRQDVAVTVRGVRLPMTNIGARINPEAKTQVLLCAHWDTRPTADQEIDPGRKRRPIDGANDGASGVAVLIELARNFAAKRPDVGVQFVFFDGEDYGPGLETMFLGAAAYARKPLFPKPKFGILIDMIGDKDLGIYREVNSEAVAADVNTLVFSTAKELGVSAFVDEMRHEILDDHLPLHRIGWKVIDLIDFDYGPWHTLDDTVDKCSPEALKAVGDVLAKVVYDLKPVK